MEGEDMLSKSMSIDSSEDLPSDSDSEHGDELFSPLPITTSMDASLTLSAPSSMETSIYDESEVCV